MKDIKLRFWNTDYKNPIMEYGSIRDLDKMYRAQDKNIMLSTGLQDVAGKDIYEGDIVDIGKVMERFCIIEFKNAKFSLKFLDDFEKGSPTDIDFFIDRIKIVGNIYETPELIEQSLGGVTNTI